MWPAVAASQSIVPGSPFSTGGFPYAVAVDPSVANSNSSNVSEYSIDPATGALTQIPSSPFPTGTNPFSVAVSPSGGFAYVANFTSNNVSAYSIAPNGAL